jgi:hypothetical protein
MYYQISTYCRSWTHNRNILKEKKASNLNTYQNSEVRDLQKEIENRKMYWMDLSTIGKIK